MFELRQSVLTFYLITQSINYFEKKRLSATIRNGDWRSRVA